MAKRPELAPNSIESEANVGENSESGTGTVEAAPAPNHTVIGGDVVATAKSTKSPAFQFYPKDFLSSSKVDRMSMTERGVYITLLARCWLDSGLPSDISELAGMVRMKRSQFERMWVGGQLQQCFAARSGGLLTNERLDQERAKQADFRRRQSDNGNKGGRPKKGPGSSGLATSKPEESGGLRKESSPISDLQSPISDLRTAVEKPTARPQPIVQKRRGDAVFEYGRLYVPNRAHQDFLMLQPDGEARLLAWYERVCEDWTNGAHKPPHSPGADLIRFWKARYDEEYPPTVVAAAAKPSFGSWRPSEVAR